MTLKVGSPIWIFDSNHRVYPRDGSMHSSPIWREHWRKHVIVGETRVSWLVGVTPNDAWPTKINKRNLANGALARAALASKADVDAECFVHDHAYMIGQSVQRLSGGISAAETLRKIAALVGYEEEPKR